MVPGKSNKNALPAQNQTCSKAPCAIHKHAMQIQKATAKSGLNVDANRHSRRSVLVFSNSTENLPEATALARLAAEEEAKRLKRGGDDTPKTTHVDTSDEDDESDEDNAVETETEDVKGNDRFRSIKSVPIRQDSTAPGSIPISSDPMDSDA